MRGEPPKSNRPAARAPERSPRPHSTNIRARWTTLSVGATIAIVGATVSFWLLRATPAPRSESVVPSSASVNPSAGPRTGANTSSSDAAPVPPSPPDGPRVSTSPESATSPNSAPAAGASLNLLLISCDTTRADHIGCYGDAAARTPNIDALAAQGTRFARCTACTPLTMPSHSTIFTGVYPFVHGVRQNAIDRLSPAFETLAETLQRAGFATHAVVAAFVLQGRFGLGQGFDTYSDRFRPRDGNPAAAERRADEVVDEAIARLRENAGRRFFLWAHFYDPHYPYESTQHADPASREAYADEIAFMDAEIGRLLTELRTLGLAERTLIVLVGDHGEGLGDHGESEHGYFVHDTDMHVPLILTCPGVVSAARVVDAQVRTVDITPTALDYLGIAPAAAMQGVSLRDLEFGRATDLGLAAYGESMLAHSLLGLSRLRFLQQDGWKYVHAATPQLLHLPSDPREQVDRSADEPARAQRLRDQLRTLLESAGTPEPPDSDAPALTEEDIQRLSSLGYAGGATHAQQDAAASLESLEPGGGDPHAHTAVIESYVRAHRLLAERDFAAAEPLLLEVVRSLPRATEPLAELRMALRAQDRESELLGLCVELVQARPDATAARVLLAELFLRERNEADAIAELRRAIEADPQCVAAHRSLGMVHRRRGELEEARAHLEAAVELAPRDAAGLGALAQVYMQMERFAEAATLLRRALAITPNSSAMQRDLDEAMKRLNP